ATITPAPLTITYTATPATSIYGAALAPLAGSESAAGLVNGQTLAQVTSGTATWSTTATSASVAGSYPITGSGLTGISHNYTYGFIQAPGNATALTITPQISCTGDDGDDCHHGNDHDHGGDHDHGHDHHGALDDLELSAHTHDGD
ncbi:MAG: hypothetical protein KGJ05_08060, partial [Alphaproteobacteria bacterium]|nr:hypothetical protein [Alphaproteobacteria bacterium]